MKTESSSTGGHHHSSVFHIGELLRHFAVIYGDEAGPNEEILRIAQGRTPIRSGEAWTQMLSGYLEDAHSMLKEFDLDCTTQLVLLKDIEFYSTCEHHLLPFYGKAHVAYIPEVKYVGVSKLARVLDTYSRRLQVQERICAQVTQAIVDVLEPAGAACVIEAKHLCIACRGVQKQHSVMVTSSLTGVFLKEPEARMELFTLINGGKP